MKGQRAQASPKSLPRDLAPAFAVRGAGGAEQRAVFRIRFALFGAAFLAAFAVLAGRLLVLGLPGGETGAAMAIAADASRGRADLTDRNGILLATDLSLASLYADGREVWDPAETAAELVRVLPDLDEAALRAQFETRRAFIWIRRGLTPRQQEAVHRLGLPGLGFRKETRRIYPNGRAAAHMLGYVDIDNHGLAGLERGLDSLLADPARSAGNIATALDLSVQHVLTGELRAAVAEFRALGAAGLVMDVSTGELVAAASLPDFDPNVPAADPKDHLFNRITLGTYEMGSTFKAFTTAMALESGRATLATSYDATRPLRYGRHTISDFHPENRWLTLAEVFEHSSNIGSARMALDVGPEGHRAFLGSLGFLEAAPIELREIGLPQAPRQWGEIHSVTISFGHGMAVTPLHVAAAGAAMVNGGIYRAPTLLKRSPEEADPGRRVISESTSATMRQLFRLVVEKGTGRKADVEGYPVSGKTGTAEKARAGGYARKALMSSFLGFFPADAPRYLVLIMLDEPKGNASTFGYATGGWTAAPTAGKVIRRIAPILHVPPQLPQPAAETITAAAPSGAAHSDVHALEPADQ